MRLCEPAFLLFLLANLKFLKMSSCACRLAKDLLRYTTIGLLNPSMRSHKHCTSVVVASVNDMEVLLGHILYYPDAICRIMAQWTRNTHSSISLYSFAFSTIFQVTNTLFPNSELQLLFHLPVVFNPRTLELHVLNSNWNS